MLFCNIFTEKLRDLLKKQKLFICMSILYVGIFFLIVSFYKYNLSFDATIFIRIAEQYKGGLWYDALNTFRGPLLSWLMIPFLLLGFSGVVSIQIVSFFAGFITLIAWLFFIKRNFIDKSIRVYLALTLTFLLVFFVFANTSPDALLTSLVMLYFLIIGDYYLKHPKSGILAGVLGAFMYLTKAFGFPFFLSHFIFINFFYWQQGEKVGKKFFAGAVCFLIISAAWVGAISYKNGSFTIYNAMFHGPKVKVLNSLDEKPEFPYILAPPSSPSSLSVYDDPSGEIKYLKHSLNKFPRQEIFKVKVALIKNRLILLRDFMCAFSPFSFLLIVMSFIFILQEIKRHIENRQLQSFIFLLLFIGGYSITHFEQRYLWPVAFCFVLMGGDFVKKLFKHKVVNSISMRFILFVFFLSFLFLPGMYLFNNFDKGKNDFTLSKQAEEILKGSKITSNYQKDIVEKTLFLALYNKWIYYIPRSGDVSVQLDREIRENSIDYYFFWTSKDCDEEFHRGTLCFNFDAGSNLILKVYNLKEF
jgi:4-amino-4-deoxy-L-arabinose transferase-like glycosyltransferase